MIPRGPALVDAPEVQNVSPGSVHVRLSDCVRNVATGYVKQPERTSGSLYCGLLVPPAMTHGLSSLTIQGHKYQTLQQQDVRVVDSVDPFMVIDAQVQAFIA